MFWRCWNGLQRTNQICSEAVIGPGIEFRQFWWEHYSVWANSRDFFLLGMFLIQRLWHFSFLQIYAKGCFIPELLGDSSPPVYVQSAYPSCICAPSLFNITNTQKSDGAPPACPQGANERFCLSLLALTDNWFSLFFCSPSAIDSVYSLPT